MTAPLLSVLHVRQRFGASDLLTDAAFTAVPGRITALMGRNGAGKTTLLRIAVGLVRPRTGRVSWDGTVVPRPSLSTMARRGLFYGDQGSLLTRGFTVARHLDALCAIYGDGMRAEAVEAMRLEECIPRHPSRISGGERQRATLAMAIVRGPRCLIMDEPFAGVAPRDRELIAGGLTRLRRDGCAIVISGHDVHDLLAVADEVIWVADGTTRPLGSPARAADDPAFRAGYLGTGD